MFERWDNSDLAARFAISPATRQTIDVARNLPVAPTGVGLSVATINAEHRSIEERLFAARAAAKSQTALVAVRISREWREGLFKQLDSLMDPEEWDPKDEPLTVESFTNFLRSMFYLRPSKRPGIGSSSAGNLIATWTEDANRLTIEYLPGGKARWVLSNSIEGDVERIAGVTASERLAAALGPYIARGWFQRTHD